MRFNGLFFKTFYKALIIYLFVSCMLVDNVKLVFKFHQPVGVKQLANQLMAASGFWCQKFLLKKLKLLSPNGWIFCTWITLSRLRFIWYLIVYGYSSLCLIIGFIHSLNRYVIFCRFFICTFIRFFFCFFFCFFIRSFICLRSLF